MRLAVLGDIHANLPALESVIAALRTIAPDLIVCTGDLVGYNAEPVECVDRVRDLGATVVAGNHDADVAAGLAATGTNDVARIVQQWTRARLDTSRLEWLAALPPVAAEDGWMARHGSFLGGDPTLGYVTGSMLEENLQAIAAMEAAPVAFCGHTHVPLMGWLTGSAYAEVSAGTGETVRWPAGAKAVLINAGAVGQPRDRDPRASFVVVDLARRSATWHRVEYPVERAADAVLRAGLPSTIAERLREGR